MHHAIHDVQSPLHKRARLGLYTACLASLVACGGGGSEETDASATPASTTPATAATLELAEMTSANTSMVTSSAEAASSSALATAQAVVASGAASAVLSGSTASASVICAGGGTAVYTASGAQSSITNGVLESGESYSLVFANCRGASSAGSVSGTLTLNVTAASGSSTTVSTSSQNVVVALPQGNVTLNGSSVLSRTVSTTGTVVTTSSRWTTPGITVKTAFNARSSTFSLSNVDITASTVVSNGVLSDTSYIGSSRLSASLPNGSFDISFATQGAVHYDAGGMPTQGSWLLTLPHNAIALSVASGTVTIGVDYGPDGSIDKTYTYTTGNLAAKAG